MHIAMNGNFNWYLGLDGNPPPHLFDFVTVMLHEIAHGLNFSGSMNVAHGQAQWGYGSGYPNIYDVYMRDGSGNQIINTSVYPNPSSALLSAVTSNNLWFHGSNAMAANGGTRVKMYAPSTWAPGSSYSHVDYDTFRFSPHRLMVYAGSPGDAVHDPGTVTIGLLKDLGWRTSSAPTVEPLINGVPVTGLSGAQNSERFFSIAVPSGATNLQITTAGGTGDVDLYVRRGSLPTTSQFDCQSWDWGNNETCTFANPTADTYYVMLHGYSAYSGVTLTASYSATTCPYDDHLVLQNASVTGSAIYGACRTITAGPAFVVTATGDATFRAGQRITLRPGFAVRAGGRFRAQIEPALASNALVGGQLSTQMNPADGSSLAGLAHGPEQDPAGAQTQNGGSAGSTWWRAPTGGYAPGPEGLETTAASDPSGIPDDGTADSAEHDLPAPHGLAATPGDRSVALRWEGAPTGDGFHVYWSRSAGIHPFTAASYDGFLGNVHDSRMIVGELENDAEYFFVVTATRGGRESAASIEVAAIPEAGPVLVAGRYRLDALDAATVVDLETGLEWKRCPLGQQWDGAACAGAATGSTFAEAHLAAADFNRQASAEGMPWRVPEIAELQGLVYCTSGVPAPFPDGLDTGCWGSHGVPTLEPTVFPSESAAGGWFWSGSAAADGQAWGIDFDRGQAIPYQRSAFSGVRLVRPVPQGGAQ